MNPHNIEQVWPHSWSWPFQLEKYDRSEMLTDAEKELLEKVFRQALQVRGRTKGALRRLYQPLADVCNALHTPQPVMSRVVRCTLFETLHREKTLWAWTAEEWRQSICQNPQDFALRYGLSLQRHDQARLILVALAYLLCPHISLEPLLLVAPALLAKRIFGREIITSTVERIRTVLQGWGYRQHRPVHLTTCVSYLLLKNRSPLLEDLTIEFLQAAVETCQLTGRKYFFQVSRALKALGILSGTLPGFLATTFRDKDESIAPEWFSWCERWRKQTTLQRPEGIYYPVLMVGRWLKKAHPEVTSPAQWTYELAAEFVAATSRVTIGEWANPSLRTRRTPLDRLGQPLRPHAKKSLLGAMRTFLRDCQEWGWIPVHFNPDRALRTPASIRRLTGPSPRVISSELWAKILWAAMNLELDDLPVWGNGNDLPPYPVEMVRAIAVVWCFTALRSDEIRRLICNRECWIEQYH